MAARLTSKTPGLVALHLPDKVFEVQAQQFAASS